MLKVSFAVRGETRGLEHMDGWIIDNHLIISIYNCISKKACPVFFFYGQISLSLSVTVSYTKVQTRSMFVIEFSSNYLQLIDFVTHN